MMEGTGNAGSVRSQGPHQKGHDRHCAVDRHLSATSAQQHLRPDQKAAHSPARLSLPPGSLGSAVEVWLSQRRGEHRTNGKAIGVAGVFPAFEASALQPGPAS